MASVYMNARFLTQPFTGVQRYSYELALRLPLKGFIAPEEPRPDYADLDRSRLILRKSRLRGHLWEQVVLPQSLPAGSLLWSPSSGPLSVFNQVLTIHDMSFWEEPRWFSRSYVGWYRMQYPILVSKVRRILTVSHYSKSRIVQLLRVPERQVVVIHEAVDERFQVKPEEEARKALAAYQIGGPYLLATGAYSPRKNFARLFEVWKGMIPFYPDLHLVVIGVTKTAFSGGYDLGELPPRTHFLGHVPEDKLVYLYNGALAFCYPSLYEGFGLPALEAMACGCPVITSDGTSLPEVVGDAAVLVDPYSNRSLEEGIRQVVEDERLRESLRQKGLMRCRQFSWERTAEQTWSVLQEAAGP